MSPTPEFHDVAWPVWAAVTAGSFAALETSALLKGERHTLSCHIRKWIGVYPKRRWAMAGAGAFVGFCGWLAVHITFGVMPWVENR